MLHFLGRYFTGGIVFEQYLNLAVTQKNYYLWNRIKKRGFINPDEMDQLIKHDGCYFHGFFLQSVHMSGLSRQQLFYTTYSASCHGLSKMGKDILARYGFATPNTSFLRLRDDLLQRAKTKVRYRQDYAENFDKPRYIYPTFP